MISLEIHIVSLGLLALSEHVHVALAHADLASVLLHALEQALVEAHAGVLQLLLWRSLLLVATVAVVNWLLLSGCRL